MARRLSLTRIAAGRPSFNIISASGGNARRISYGQGSYGSPVWSPRGDVIAFSRIANGSFSLGVMGPDGGMNVS